MDLQPTIPGYAPGIIARTPTPTGTVWTVQCEACGDTETTGLLMTAKIKFLPHRDRSAGRTRMCPECRVVSLTAQGHTEAEARHLISH